MTPRLEFSYPKGAFRSAFNKQSQAIALAATATIRDAAAEVLARGAANIASAGFSSRWQKGLRAVVTPKAGPATAEASVHVFHSRGFATVFETGARISGKPLLWLPLPTLPDKIGGRWMTPKNFVKSIGPLHTIKAPGKPPLLGAYMSGLVGSKVTIAKLRRGSALARLGVRSRRGAYGAKGVVSTIVFVGISQVSIRRRWNLTGVYAAAVENLGANYARHLAEVNR